MKVYAGQQGRKGFTMLEVVLVVAILSIIAAITVPGVVRLSRELKITKLDDIAREIYTSAQSQSIALSVGGQLSQVEGYEVKLPAVVDAGDPTAETPAVSGLKYVTKTDTDSSETIEMLLPLGSIEEVVRQHYYIIEYDPVTAMITGVFYWENESNNLPIEYASGEVENLKKDGATSTAKENRMNHESGMVGYYGGDNVTRPQPPTEADSAVTAKLINDEELYLEITQGLNGGTPLDGTITVTLTDLDVGGTRTIAVIDNFTGVADPSESIIGISSRLAPRESGGGYILILDSLRAGMRFSQLIPEDGSGSFHPGCDLKVTVTFQETGKRAQSKEFRTNSLYASVQGPYKGPRTARIACGRHLANLGLLFVYPDGETTSGDDLNGVTKAVQTKSIDWHKSLEKVGTEKAVSFTPILNDKLTAYDGQGNTISHVDIFDADTIATNSVGLSEFIRDELSEGVGLFSQFKGSSLQNTRLVNCTIKDLSMTDPNNVGLLAGTIESASCTVSKCYAYAEKPKPASTDDPANPPATDPADDVLDCSIEVSDAETAGGLFGSVQNTAEIKESSASLTSLVGGTGAIVGGLAGSVGDGATITKCYADTGLWSAKEEDSAWASGLSGRTVGGLLGDAGSSLKLEYSYAVGWADPGDTPDSTTVYGLVGSGDSTPSTIENCYAAVLKGYDIADLVPADLASATGINTCINYSGGYDDFNDLVGDPYTDKNKGATHAYGMPVTVAEDGTEVDPVYPFPRLSGMPHYGDWPQEGTFEAVMAYYEVYQDGSIGFYNQEVKALQTLEDPEEDAADNPVVMDGYAVMLPVKNGKYNGIAKADILENLTVIYNEHSNKNADESDVTSGLIKLMDAQSKFESIPVEVKEIPKGGADAGEITLEKTTYYPLFLSSALMMPNGASVSDAYYQTLEVQVGESNEKTAVNVQFNPYVAKSKFVKVKDPEDTESESSTVSETAEEPTSQIPEVSTPEASILRTARQVAAYSYDAMQQTAVGNGETPHTLWLGRDIDCSTEIMADSTVDSKTIECKDLSIPADVSVSAPAAASDETPAYPDDKPYVILELNGKTLTGTGTGSVITSAGGMLEVHGRTGTEDQKGTITASSTGTSSAMVQMTTGTRGILENVIIDMQSNSSVESVNMNADVTLRGCEIKSSTSGGSGESGS